MDAGMVAKRRPNRIVDEKFDNWVPLDRMYLMAKIEDKIKNPNERKTIRTDWTL